MRYTDFSEKNCRAKVFHIFIFSVYTHGLTDLIFHIKKIEIKLYRVLQSVFLLTDFFLVTPFPCKGNYFVLRKGIVFSIFLIL